MDRLPADVLRSLVYNAGLERLEDRLSLLICCRAILGACGGLHRPNGSIYADGGDRHWNEEARRAGYVCLRPYTRGRARYFEMKGARCASCETTITHRTGRIVLQSLSGTGLGGDDVRIVTCFRCGPLAHRGEVASCSRSRDDDLERVLGGFVRRREVDLRQQEDVAARVYAGRIHRTGMIGAALRLTGMSRQSVVTATGGSAAFARYVTDERGCSLECTVQEVCRLHWLDSYTWLPCACAMCGVPFSDAAKDDVYRRVLTAYGGYPQVWPWSVGEGTDSIYAYHDLAWLADRIVEYYADKMMLDALFQRMVRADLCWLGDHSWLSRIKDALTQPTTFMIVPCPSPDRVGQLVRDADLVGGYLVRWGAAYMTLTCVHADQ